MRKHFSNIAQNFATLVILLIGGIGVQTIISCSGGDDGGDGSPPVASNCSINGGTVTIGSQVWMAENLNCNVSGSKCYDNDPANCTKYGRLYNWEAAMRACPSGWHLPSDDEWTTLTDFVGGDSIAGKKLKATSGWNYNGKSGNGIDEYGFSALPGGDGISDGRFLSVGKLGYWWSASEVSFDLAHYRDIDYGYDNVSGFYGEKSKYFFSVRCVQDDGGGSPPVPSYCSLDGGKVTIGTQVWMAENLNCDVNGSKCYGDDPANCAKYGRLYDWATAMALHSGCNSTPCASQVGVKHRGICPSGWHIPSDAEWTTLTDYLGGASTAGEKLKSTNGWNEGGNGTDEYGFAALPGGNGGQYGDFYYVGYNGNWWSTTEYSGAIAYRRYMNYYYQSVVYDFITKDDLFSVRCLKD